MGPLISGLVLSGPGLGVPAALERDIPVTHALKPCDDVEALRGGATASSRRGDGKRTVVPDNSNDALDWAMASSTGSGGSSRWLRSSVSYASIFKPASLTGASTARKRHQSDLRLPPHPGS